MIRPVNVTAALLYKQCRTVLVTRARHVSRTTVYAAWNPIIQTWSDQNLNMPLLYGIHTPLPKLNILKRYSTVQPHLSKKSINAKQSQLTDLIACTTLGWPTLERRRIIKQAMTFYKKFNNIINITPPPGLLKPSKNRGHYISTRCRINTVHSVLLLPSSNSHLEYDPTTYY